MTLPSLPSAPVPTPRPRPVPDGRCPRAGTPRSRHHRVNGDPPSPAALGAPHRTTPAPGDSRSHVHGDGGPRAFPARRHGTVTRAGHGLPSCHRGPARVATARRHSPAPRRPGGREGVPPSSAVRPQTPRATAPVLPPDGTAGARRGSGPRPVPAQEHPVPVRASAADGGHDRGRAQRAQPRHHRVPAPPRHRAASARVSGPRPGPGHDGRCPTAGTPRSGVRAPRAHITTGGQRGPRPWGGYGRTDADGGPSPVPGGTAPTRRTGSPARRHRATTGAGHGLRRTPGSAPQPPARRPRRHRATTPPCPGTTGARHGGAGRSRTHGNSGPRSFPARAHHRAGAAFGTGGGSGSGRSRRGGRCPGSGRPFADGRGRGGAPVRVGAVEGAAGGEGS